MGNRGKGKKSRGQQHQRKNRGGLNFEHHEQKSPLKQLLSMFKNLQERKIVEKDIAEAMIAKVCNNLNIPLKETCGRESDSNSGKGKIPREPVQELRKREYKIKLQKRDSCT